MSTKNDVLSMLMDAPGPVSGQWLARQLGVSRNAVWKAIGQLRKEGFDIEAATNRGYRLREVPNRVSEPEIRRWLKAKTFGAKMELHECLDSTNTRAKALAAAAAPHGTLVVAESQTGGKGRMGRAFFSPEHTGVYITFVLRPQVTAERAAMLTSLAAVAVARAIEEIAHVKVKIKWVNDLFIRGKKVCGILCEASVDFESGGLEYAVMGIGVNVAAMKFPKELRDIATSIENECGYPVSRNRLIAGICNQLEAVYGDLETGAFMEENRVRSNVIGRDVWVIRGDTRFEARVLDIDAQGRLVIRTDAGVECLSSGEISLKLK